MHLISMYAFDINNIRALILDMDGVLWRGSQPIGDLPAIFTRIEARGWRTILATNNATRTIEQYLERLRSYGVVLEPWQVINSAQATASYLSQRFPDGGPVYIIGEKGLYHALEQRGFIPGEDGAVAVVVGMDRELTYTKLRVATLLIRSGVPFVATNPDRTYPSPDGLVPGAGSILAALEAATYVHPIIAGKPDPEMYRIALERLETAPQETLVVGDRPETDIAGAQVLGCPSALVLSGVTSLEQAHAWQPPPELIAPDLASIVYGRI